MYVHFGSLILNVFKLCLQHLKLVKVLYACFLFQCFPCATFHTIDRNTHHTWAKFLVKNVSYSNSLQRNNDNGLDLLIIGF